MDTMTIVYIAIAFAIGAFLAYFLAKSKKESISTLSSSSSDESLIAENNSLKSQLQDALAQIDDMAQSESDGGASHRKIKAKYEALLKETKDQCALLDRQLKEALNGNAGKVSKGQFAEIEKLKKKVKDLENELEENEDDISDLKKKVKSKESELAQYQDELGRERRASKELQTELSSLRQELEDKVKELRLKMSSLDFIQEIISAKEISTNDAKKLYKSIDVFEAFIKGKFMELRSFLFLTYNYGWGESHGKQGLDESKRYFIETFDEWAATKRKSWLDGKTTIAFVGEFSAGKTSIVNRILSQDNPDVPRLPVSMKATTAVPTYIAGGPTETYSFISADDKRKTILQNTFKMVSKEMLDQIKGVSSLIKYFVMTYKNPNLNGLSILDTPGFNSNDKEDKERTIDVINECDALFWVFDVNMGTVNRSSIKLIKEKLNKPLYVVINKVDTKSEKEVQKVENLIKQTLANEGLQVLQFIRFSTKTPLANIMTPIKSVKRIDSRDTFIQYVKGDIEWFLNDLSNAVTTKNNSYKEIDEQGDELQNKFVDVLKKMQDVCIEASNIPRWETHIFSSDRYEMDEYECNRMKELLEWISDDSVPYTASVFSDCMDKAHEAQQAYSDLIDLKNH